MSRSRGQILPLALVCILMTTLLWVTLINVGKLLKDRIQLQIAADTAAQSACAIRARGLSAIGRMNSWLGIPGAGIGLPFAAWWPDAAPLQQKFVALLRRLQTAYNQAYGGGYTANLVRGIARDQGADDIYVPKGDYSLRLQRNHGPIWYLSTRHVYVYGVPVPYPFLPQITEEAPETQRWYEQGPGFHRKVLRVYAYRRAGSPKNRSFPLGRQVLNIQMPGIYTVAAARVYNVRGPMFPKAIPSGRIVPGIDVRRAYSAASERWQAQLVPVGGRYEH